VNREEAKLELDATTLRPQDASPEARAFAENDPELNTWLKKRTAFDEKAAEAFSPSLPAGFRERLLEAAKPTPKRQLRWVVPALISAAACIVLGWTLLWPVNDQMPNWKSESLAAVVKVQYGMSRVDHLSNDLTTLKTMLVSEQAPIPVSLPGSIANMPVVACKRITVAGRPASIICFLIRPGKEAHLVVMEGGNLSDRPPQLKPEFQQEKNWNMASWSDGTQTFLLATTADESALREVFG
jgi:hypothetical protein